MLTMKDLRKFRILDELAEVFHTLELARDLAELAGFPMKHFPGSGGGQSLSRWRAVCREIVHGRPPGAVEHLLRLAAEEYPHNHVFEPWLGWTDDIIVDPSPPIRHGPPEIEDRDRKAIDLRRSIRSRAAEEVDDRIDSTPGPEVLFTVPLEDGIDLASYVKDWLANDDGPAVVVLSGAIGSGKTVTTCQLFRRLQGAATPGEEIPVVLWIPFVYTFGHSRDPDDAICRSLRLDSSTRLWGIDANVRLIILDGLDEGLGIERDNVYLWLARLFDRVSRAVSRPRFLISGRDVALDLIRPLADTLAAAAGAAEGHAELRLATWGVDEHTFFELLASKVGERKAERLVGLITPETLSSPLLFGLAYNLLTRPDWAKELGRRRRPIAAQDLIAHWIKKVVSANYFRYPGRPGGLLWEDRLQAARVIALLLVASGRGIKGATIDELRSSPVLQRLWFSVATSDDELEEITWELKVGCLLRCQGDYYAPFHHTILVHLAAQALDGTILYTDDVVTGDPPAFPPGKLVIEDPGFEREGLAATVLRAAPLDPQSRVTAGRALVQLTDRLETLLEEAAMRLSPTAVQSGSLLEEALNHWARRRVRKNSRVPPLDLRDRAEELEDERSRLRVSVEVVVRDALARTRCRAPRPGRAVTVPLPGLEFPHPELAEIPAGPHVVWRLAEAAGDRLVDRVDLPRPVLLARGLCTVEEYAAFLNDNPEAPLPRQAEAGWTRSGGVADYNPSRADSPVTGISQRDALDYCRWLTGRLSAYPELPILGCRLPDPDWLRVAAWGPELREVTRDVCGPYGHEQLICHCWHWTQRAPTRSADALDSVDGAGRGSECLVFGGTRTLIEDLALEKVLIGRYPDLCRPVARTLRDPEFGFRVAFEASEHG